MTFFLILKSYKKTKDKSFIGIADVITPNRFEISFPFGFMPNIKFDHVTLRLGISYGMSSYSTRNMTFYDSKCRSCSTGVLDENLVGLKHIF
jgi:hypothetical protein